MIIHSQETNVVNMLDIVKAKTKFTPFSHNLYGGISGSLQMVLELKLQHLGLYGQNAN